MMNRLPVSRNQDVAFREIATLLARGYLRLAGFRPAETAPIASRSETAPGSPNCLDVVGRAEHELGRGVRR